MKSKVIKSQFNIDVSIVATFFLILFAHCKDGVNKYFCTACLFTEFRAYDYFSCISYNMSDRTIC